MAVGCGGVRRSVEGCGGMRRGGVVTVWRLPSTEREQVRHTGRIANLFSTSIPRPGRNAFASRAHRSLEPSPLTVYEEGEERPHKTCNNCGSKEHMLWECPHEVVCTICGKKGHTHHVCRKAGVPWGGVGGGFQSCELPPRFGGNGQSVFVLPTVAPCQVMEGLRARTHEMRGAGLFGVLRL